MLTVKAIITAAERSEALRDTVDWAREIYLAYAWASSAGGAAEHWRALQVKKVKQAVIGLHFEATEPLVLRTLHARGVLRVREDAVGVFHPKVLVATRDKGARVIVGSSNFTAGGFEKNTEVNVLLSGPREDDTIVRLLSFIHHQWTQSVIPSKTVLAEYEARHLARLKAPAVDAPGPRSTPEARQGDARTPIEFHDRDGIIEHDAFQDWREAHPHGFYLTFKSLKRVNLHRATCWHQGTYRFGEYNSSATKARKVCAEAEEVLRQLSRVQGLDLTRCPHCIEYDPRTFLFDS